MLDRKEVLQRLENEQTILNAFNNFYCNDSPNSALISASVKETNQKLG